MVSYPSPKAVKPTSRPHYIPLLSLSGIYKEGMTRLNFFINDHRADVEEWFNRIYLSPQLVADYITKRPNVDAEPYAKWFGYHFLQPQGTEAYIGQICRVSSEYEAYLYKCTELIEDGISVWEKED